MSGAAARSFDWDRILRWGVPWGVAVTVAEAMVISRGPGPLPDLATAAWILLWIGPAWCVTGCLFVACMARAEAAAGTQGLIGAWIAVSLLAALLYVAVSAAAWHALNALMLPDAALRRSAEVWLATPAVRDALFAYHAWINLFFGGLLAASLALDLRAERTQLRLHAVMLAWRRAAAMAGTHQLESMRTQVDPRLLVDTMGEIRDLYSRDPTAAERLLDRLVAFLRAAMPGLRHRGSTLAAEFGLATALAELQEARGLRHAWRVVQRTVAPPQLPFPARVIPALLALGAGRDSPTLELDTRQAGGLRIAARGLSELPFGLARSLRAQLCAVHPAATLIEGAAEGGAEVLIDLAGEMPERRTT
jgi:hypothetical protein